MSKQRICPACGVNALAKRCRKCADCKRARASKPRQASKLERTFLTRWLQFAGDQPEPVSEFVFAPPRQWRADFAWPDKKLLVEIEGGVFGKSRHTSGTGYTEDCHKYNAATCAGYRVLRFTGTMLDRDPAGCVAQVVTLLEAA